MTDFATFEDVVSRWRPFRDESEQAVAVERIGDASAFLRILVPDLAVRAASNPDVARAAKSTTVESVRRYLSNPEGAKSLQETIGPRSFGLTFEGRATGIFFTEAELAALRPVPVTSSQPLSFSGGYARSWSC